MLRGATLRRAVIKLSYDRVVDFIRVRALQLVMGGLLIDLVQDVRGLKLRLHSLWCLLLIVCDDPISCLYGLTAKVSG